MFIFVYIVRNTFIIKKYHYGFLFSNLIFLFPRTNAERKIRYDAWGHEEVFG